jgi:hypothetical protein
VPERSSVVIDDFSCSERGRAFTKAVLSRLPRSWVCSFLRAKSSPRFLAAAGLRGAPNRRPSQPLQSRSLIEEIKLMKDFEKCVSRSIEASIAVKQQLLQDDKLIATIAAVSRVIVDAMRLGNKILVFGNGGSAADAQHIVANLLDGLHLTVRRCQHWPCQSTHPV